MSEGMNPAHCVDSHETVRGVLHRTYLPFLNQKTNANGPWLDTRCLKGMTAEVYGTFDGAKVEWFATNYPGSDPTLDGGITGLSLGEITQHGTLSIQTPFRYIRPVQSGSGAGTNLTAVLHGVA